VNEENASSNNGMDNREESRMQNRSELMKSAGKTKTKKRIVIITLSCILSFALIGGGTLATILISNSKIEVSTGGMIEGKQLERLKTRISKHIVFDKYEKANATAIKDTETLANTAGFFKNAKNGDYILILLDTRRIIIYRESDDILVNVGPIVADDDDEKEDGKSNEKNDKDNKVNENNQNNKQQENNKESGEENKKNHEEAKKEGA
jgi:hypothetical protein